MGRLAQIQAPRVTCWPASKRAWLMGRICTRRPGFSPAALSRRKTYSPTGAWGDAIRSGAGCKVARYHRAASPHEKTARRAASVASPPAAQAKPFQTGFA